MEWNIFFKMGPILNWLFIFSQLLKHSERVYLFLLKLNLIYHIIIGSLWKKATFK